MLGILRYMYVDSFAHPGRNVVMLEIQPGSTVVDFGAGSGQYTFLFAQTVGAEGRVYAVDVQPSLLLRIKNEARRRGLDNVEIIVGDIARPHGAKLRSHSAHFVLMSNVLFQLEHKRAALDEAHRILEPGGRLAIIDWSERAGRIGPSSAHVYGRREAARDAASSQFHPTGEFPAGAHHYGLMFEAA